MTEISSEPREVQVATLGIRALSAIIDIVVIIVIWSAFGIAFGDAPESGVGFSFEGIPALISFAGMFAYFIVSEAVWSATPGKMIVGLRVVGEDDGLNIDWGKSVIRNMLRVVDAFPTLYLVGFFFAVSSPKTQRLGDRIARTVVVRA